MTGGAERHLAIERKCPAYSTLLDAGLACKNTHNKFLNFSHFFMLDEF